MKYTVVVGAPAEYPAGLQFLAQYTTAAMGEYYRDIGKGALVVYDDLNNQEIAYQRKSSLLRSSRRPEEYRGNVFYLNS